MNYDFLMIAGERGKDAHTLKAHERRLAAIYMAGYGVECRLKGLLQSYGKPFPSSGARGHDLVGLWESAGFRVKDVSGSKRLFIETWNTALRYETVLPEEMDFDALYKGAMELSGYVQRRIRAKHRRTK